MARMACAVAAALPPLAVIELALVPLAQQTAGVWSIDDEPSGAGWHESSWMLRRGLEVSENPPPDAIPPEWEWKWWLAAGA